MYPLFHETNQLVINSCTRAITLKKEGFSAPWDFVHPSEYKSERKSRRLPYSKAVPSISGSKGKKEKDIMNIYKYVFDMKQ
eukprot:UN02953